MAGLAESLHGNVYEAVATPFGSLAAKFVDAASGSLEDFWMSAKWR